MANSWFRLYSEFAHDSKIQVLTETLQRRYVMLLCLMCSEQYENRPNDEIALSLRVTLEEWEFTKNEFIKRGLLHDDGKINGWEKRQYISDLKDPTAAERQKRYRDNKRNNSNDTVTLRLPEQIQNRTEHKKHNILFDEFWKKYPKKVGKDAACKLWVKLQPDINLVIQNLDWQINSQQWKDGFIPNPATYLNQGRWKDEPVVRLRGLQN